jgi:hypothetical protein
VSLLSNIEKLALPILCSMLPFWIPTGDLVCQLEATSRKVACRLFVASPQSTSFVVSQAEGEGAPARWPGALGPYRPNTAAMAWGAGLIRGCKAGGARAPAGPAWGASFFAD